MIANKPQLDIAADVRIIMKQLSYNLPPIGGPHAEAIISVIMTQVAINQQRIITWVESLLLSDGSRDAITTALSRREN